MREAGGLDRLRGRLPALDAIEVVGDAAKGHGQSDDLVAAELNLLGLQVFLRLSEGKGLQPDTGRDAVMKAAFVVDDFRDHPRSRRATDDEEKLRVPDQEGIPKVIEGWEEAGLRAGEPREFIEKDDVLLTFRQRDQVVGEQLEGFLPRARLRGLLPAADRREGGVEIGELFLQRCLKCSGHFERHFLLIVLSN